MIKYSEGQFLPVPPLDGDIDLASGIVLLTPKDARQLLELVYFDRQRTIKAQTKNQYAMLMRDELFHDRSILSFAYSKERGHIMLDGYHRLEALASLEEDMPEYVQGFIVNVLRTTSYDHEIELYRCYDRNVTRSTADLTIILFSPSEIELFGGKKVAIALRSALEIIDYRFDTTRKYDYQGREREMRPKMLEWIGELKWAVSITKNMHSHYTEGNRKQKFTYRYILAMMLMTKRYSARIFGDKVVDAFWRNVVSNPFSLSDTHPIAHFGQRMVRIRNGSEGSGGGSQESKSDTPGIGAKVKVKLLADTFNKAMIAEKYKFPYNRLTKNRRWGIAGNYLNFCLIGTPFWKNTGQPVYRLFDRPFVFNRSQNSQTILPLPAPEDWPQIAADQGLVEFENGELMRVINPTTDKWEVVDVEDLLDFLRFENFDTEDDEVIQPSTTIQNLLSEGLFPELNGNGNGHGKMTFKATVEGSID